MSLKSIRFGQLLSEGRAGLTHHHLTAKPYAKSRQLCVGSNMLDMFGLKDEWQPVRYDSLVCEIKNAFVLSSSGIVGLSSGEVIEDTLDHTEPALDGYERIGGHTVYGEDGAARAEGGWIRVTSCRSPSRLVGRYLSLLLGSYHNHYHWLLMNFARIALLEGTSPNIDGVLIPADLTTSQLQAISYHKQFRGVPLRPVHRSETLFVETLILPWNVACGSGVNTIAVNFLRELISVRRGTGTSSIYIDRRNSPTRKLLNEDEVVATLSRVGIVPRRLEGLSLYEQAEIFGNAKLIVAPHGAGLTNILWAPENAHLIELMPSGTMNWCYRHLAAASAITYDCVLGRSSADKAELAYHDSWLISPTHILSATLDYI